LRDDYDAGGEETGQGLRGEGGGAGGEKLENKRKRPSSSRVAPKTKAKRRLWR
jgi:hypothetical protein